MTFASFLKWAWFLSLALIAGILVSAPHQVCGPDPMSDPARYLGRFALLVMVVVGSVLAAVATESLPDPPEYGGYDECDG